MKKKNGNGKEVIIQKCKYVVMCIEEAALFHSVPFYGTSSKRIAYWRHSCVFFFISTFAVPAKLIYINFEISTEMEESLSLRQRNE